MSGAGMPRFLFMLVMAALLLSGAPATAQAPSPIQALLQEHGELIRKSSRRTVGPAIDAVAASGLPQAQTVLERWQAREMWTRESDGLFFFAEEVDRQTLRLFDIATGAEIGTFPDNDFKQLRPNGGVRAMIGAALVRFQLLDPNRDRRIAALDAIERDAEASHLEALRGAIDGEPEVDLKTRKQRLERLLTIRFGASDAERIAAIDAVAGDLGVDVRATLNPLVQTELTVSAGPVPDDPSVVRALTPGSEALPRDAAYSLLVEAGLAPEPIDQAATRAALIAHMDAGSVGGMAVSTLDTDAARDLAYAALARQGLVPAASTEADIASALAAHSF